MSEDIVEQLRVLAKARPEWPAISAELATQAADEIERLRADIAKQDKASRREAERQWIAQIGHFPW
jgi:hypothetical protein